VGEKKRGGKGEQTSNLQLFHSKILSLQKSSLSKNPLPNVKNQRGIGKEKMEEREE
jgi:hypothetical protein